IRVSSVTGVQTCALPISHVVLLCWLSQAAGPGISPSSAPRSIFGATLSWRPASTLVPATRAGRKRNLDEARRAIGMLRDDDLPRSEERRVGQETGCRT